MCFSASASFIAGATLATAGVVSISQARKPAHFFFAVIPLLFGLQQCCEGFLWLSFSDPGFYSWHVPAKLVFLVFAQIIWPFWIPLSILLMEPDLRRKKILRWFLAAGIAVSILLLCRLVLYPSSAEIDGCHVEYDVASPLWIQIVSGILYISAIVVAPFVSSRSNMRLLASVNLLSLTVTCLFFQVWFVSVWCFFAAVQSVIIVSVMRRIKKEDVK